MDDFFSQTFNITFQSYTHQILPIVTHLVHILKELKWQSHSIAQKDQGKGGKQYIKTKYYTMHIRKKRVHKNTENALKRLKREADEELRENL